MANFLRQAVVRGGYNRLAGVYAGERSRLKSGKYVEKFMALLQPGDRVLDIGCGDGIPVAATLIKKGFLVTGIDIAEQMVLRAKQNCPRGAFTVADMETLKPHEYRVEGVICLYVLFHIPRDYHQHILHILASFLPAGGPLLLSMGDRDFEGKHMCYGVEMWSSQWGPVKNRRLVEEAGFNVLTDEMATSGGEQHQMLLARKQR